MSFGAYAKTSLVAVAVCALIAALAPPAEAGSKPKFDKRYRGTLHGSTTLAYDDGNVLVADWSVGGLRLKLRKVSKDHGYWTAVYKVTGGMVNFSQNKTGSCTHTVTDSFPLIPALPNPPVSEPLAFTRTSRGRWNLLGGISVDKLYTTTETCSDQDGGNPRTFSVEVMVPQLFDSLGATGRPGKRIRGKYSTTDKVGTGTETIVRNWDLKPR